jgi:uncharacterized membrane-anchored protein YitT (DUF2179 family)
LSKKKVLDAAGRLLKIVIGSVIYAVGFQYFTYPNDIVAGGVTGIAMIINYLSGLPLGVLIIVINIPLFAIAWKTLGFDFIFYSLIGMLLSSVLLDVLSLIPLTVTSVPMLGAIYGGLIKGFGLGLIYSAGASTGGIDICTKLIRRGYPHLNFGTVMLGLDVVVITTFALLFKKYDNSMYAVISMFILAKVVDLVLYGVSTSKMCLIITESCDQIKKVITDKLHRGVTLLHGVGAYSGLEKDIILCVVKPQQIVELRKEIRQIDDKAFIIITDAKDVIGKGFGDLTVSQ